MCVMVIVVVVVVVLSLFVSFASVLFSLHLLWVSTTSESITFLLNPCYLSHHFEKIFFLLFFPVSLLLRVDQMVSIF